MGGEVASSETSTTSYIAFLRAVNVGGRTAKMEHVRALFTELGHAKVRSYIQSGNIFFASSEPDPDALARALEAQLSRGLGYDVAVFVRTVQSLEESLALAPFDGVELTPETRLAMVFTSAPLPATMSLPHMSPKQDIEIRALSPGAAFVVLRQAVGRPSNPTAYIERTFHVQATARFYATMLKILAAAGKTTTV